MATGTVTALKGVRELPRSTPRTSRSVMDTVLVTPAAIAAWKRPPFQRPLRVNEKLKELIEALKRDGGVVPGIITIGVLKSEKYLLDGQHRIEAFKLAELDEGLADIRICFYESMGDMAAAFVELNSALVKLKPDDTLRALEEGSTSLSLLRRRCPFIGYDNIRRNVNSPIIGMAQVLRSWHSSKQEAPGRTPASASDLGRDLTDDDARVLARFMSLAYSAWGTDREYQRLWGGLNLVLTMWMYRRIVITKFSVRTVLISDEQFGRCLMAMSANTRYVDWLVGRNTGERDRSPCYARLRAIFQARLESDTGKKFPAPNPAWVLGGGPASRLAQAWAVID